MHPFNGFIGITLLCTISLGATAHPHKPSFGRVLSSTPIYEYRHIKEPYRYCHTPSRRHHHTLLGSALGATSAGLASGGDPEAVIAGGLIGAGIGYSLDRRRPAAAHKHCKSGWRWRKEAYISGYRVSYRYRGQVYHTTTPHAPGAKTAINHRPAKPHRNHRHARH